MTSHIRLTLLPQGLQPPSNDCSLDPKWWCPCWRPMKLNPVGGKQRVTFSRKLWRQKSFSEFGACMQFCLCPLKTVNVVDQSIRLYTSFLCLLIYNSVICGQNIRTCVKNDLYVRRRSNRFWSRVKKNILCRLAVTWWCCRCGRCRTN